MQDTIRLMMPPTKECENEPARARRRPEGWNTRGRTRLRGPEVLDALQGPQNSTSRFSNSDLGHPLSRASSRPGACRGGSARDRLPPLCSQRSRKRKVGLSEAPESLKRTLFHLRAPKGGSNPQAPTLRVTPDMPLEQDKLHT